jgi:putative SOS response-associated peptidase YedK
MYEATYWHLTGYQQFEGVPLAAMCNLYSITTNQAAIAALFRVINQYVGNLPPMPGVFPDYPAPVVRNSGGSSSPEVGCTTHLILGRVTDRRLTVLPVSAP